MAGSAGVDGEGVARIAGVDGEGIAREAGVDGEGVLKPTIEGHHFDYLRSECVWSES